MKVRVVKPCAWAPDGIRVHRFTPGELLVSEDPRLAGGFLDVALREKWVQRVRATKPRMAPMNKSREA